MLLSVRRRAISAGARVSASKITIWLCPIPGGLPDTDTVGWHGSSGRSRLGSYIKNLQAVSPTGTIWPRMDIDGAGGRESEDVHAAHVRAGQQVGTRQPRHGCSMIDLYTGYTGDVL